MGTNGRLTIDDREYVVIPRDEYERLVAGSVTPRNEALEYALEALGRKLRAARDHAGLTQAELARKTKRAQTTVAQAEAGKIRVSEDYVLAVLKACKLPKDWKGWTFDR